MIKRQDHFQINLEQTNGIGKSVSVGILSAAAFFNNKHALRLTRHLLDAGYLRTDMDFMSSIAQCLKWSLRRDSFRDSIEIAERISWLANCITNSDSSIRSLYFIWLVQYNSEVDDGEKSEEALITFGLYVLRKAHVSLHKYFKIVVGICMEMCGQTVLSDHLSRREGIERVLEVEYGQTPDDVTVIVKDVEVGIPIEERIPGGWHSDNPMSTLGVIKGKKPIANWRVSSREAWNLTPESLRQMMEDYRRLRD